MTSKLPNLLPLEAYKVGQFNYWFVEACLISLAYGGWKFAEEYLNRGSIDTVFFVIVGFASIFLGIIMATFSRSQVSSLWAGYFYESGNGRLMASAPQEGFVYQLPCLHKEGVWRDTVFYFSLNPDSALSRERVCFDAQPELKSHHSKPSPLVSLTPRLQAGGRAAFSQVRQIPSNSHGAEVLRSSGCPTLKRPPRKSIEPSKHSSQVRADRFVLD